MHTSLRVTGVLPDRLLSVVLGLDFGRRASVKAVHQPGRVVLMHPRKGDALDVGDGGQRSVAERGALAHALGLVEPNGRLMVSAPLRNGEPSRTHSVLYSPMVVSQCALSRAIADRSDRQHETFDHQRLPEMHCSLLTPASVLSRLNTRQGGEYTGELFAQACRAAGVTQSMGPRSPTRPTKQGLYGSRGLPGPF